LTNPSAAFPARETHIVRITNGKIVEHWGNQDDLGMLQQLGLIPEPAQAGE